MYGYHSNDWIHLYNTMGKHYILKFRIWNEKPQYLKTQNLKKFAVILCFSCKFITKGYPRASPCGLLITSSLGFSNFQDGNVKRLLHLVDIPRRPLVLRLLIASLRNLIIISCPSPSFLLKG